MQAMPGVEVYKSILDDPSFQDAVLRDSTALVESGIVTVDDFIEMITPGSEVGEKSTDIGIPQADTWRDQIKDSYAQVSSRLSSIVREEILVTGGVVRYLTDLDRFPKPIENISAKASSADELNRVDELTRKSLRDLLSPIESEATVIASKGAPSNFRELDAQVESSLGSRRMAGGLESPAYAILGMEEKLKKMQLPAGYSINELYAKPPSDESNFTVKWDGEWQITLEVFRDLGAAFAVVIIIIYMLIVGWFQNFKTPIVMMIAIPLSLVGIVLGHWLLGAFFTATSFIGMIALAGVMVRNSVLLIDFIEIRLNEGVPIKQAIIDAGAVRTTPILLTTGAVVIGAIIILFDPIFQGLAISLVFGAIVSTILTLIVVPLIYYITERKKWEKNQVNTILE